MYKGNKFKNAVGTHLLQALFYEQAVDPERPDALYTLKLEDCEDATYPGRSYLSLHRLYVDMADPSEYEFSKAYLDGWAHWKKLCDCNWFKPFLSEMREELEVKLKAQAIAKIRLEAENINSKNYYNANRFIENTGLVPKKDNRGRPSKEKIKQEADKMFKDLSSVDEDYKRVFQN